MLAYLRRTRGVLAETDQVVMCAGVTQGLGLVAQALERIDQVPLAIGDPAFYVDRVILRHHGSPPMPIRVNDSGLDIGALADSTAGGRASPPRPISRQRDSSSRRRAG